MIPASKAPTGVTEGAILSPEILEAILASHALFAAHIRGGQRANLVYADVSEMCLAHRVLSGATLTGAVFRKADLRYAEFIGANLYCADLRNVMGQYADFSHADMRGASLNGSNLYRAKLDYADFRPGRLANSPNGEMVCRSGSLANVDFSDSSLCGTSFEGANLYGANFSRAVIHATRFKNARLTQANFEGAVLSNVRLEELNLPDNVLSTCVLAPPVTDSSATRHRLSSILDAHQVWVQSNGRRGETAIIDDEDLRPLGAMIKVYKLTALSARRVTAVGLDFSGVELQGANFEEADLRGVNFEDADLRGVRFRGAQLQHARFKNADLRSLHMKSGERLDTDFFRADVTDEQLAEARAAS